MQLNKFTDLGLRVLMYLSEERHQTPVTIQEIAERFQAPRNHLIKVVHAMVRQGWLLSNRGRSGGVRLAKPLQDYRLGDIIARLEDENLIDCNKPECPIRGRCRLKTLLDQSLNELYIHLNQFTLVDILDPQTKQAIIQIKPR